MTANEEDPDVTNRLLTANATADLPWPEPPSDEQNDAPHDDDYSLCDDCRAEIFYDAVESLLPFTNSLTEDSLNDSDSEAHHMNSKGGVAQSLPGLSAPVLPMDFNSSWTGIQAVNLMQPQPETGNYPSDELWLQTGQVPAGEEEHAILGKHNKCTDDTGSASNHKEGRKVSGYPLEMLAAIGSPIDDSWFRLPPVKTRPSIDSWSDARANIVHIVLCSPEEPPAIVIQTVEVMAIKDKEVKPPSTEENTKTAEQVCLIMAGKDKSEVTVERGAKKVQTQLKIQAEGSDMRSPDCGDKGDGETPLSEEHSSQVASDETRCSSLPCTVALENLCESDMTDILTSPEYTTTTETTDSVEDITPIWERMSVREEDMEIYGGKIISSQAPEEEKVSKSECQNASEEPQTPEQESDVLWKVTEDTQFPLDVDIKDRVKRIPSNESLMFSGYCSEASAVKPVHVEDLGYSPEGLSTDTVLQGAAETFLGLACVPAQKSHQTQTLEADSAAHCKDKPLHVNLPGERNEKLDFIMPLAPICPRNVHFNTNTYTTLKGDQQQARFLETESNRTFHRSGAFPSENETEGLLDVGKWEIACSDDKALFESFPGDTQQSMPLDKRSYKTSDTASNLHKELSKLLLYSADTFFICEEEEKTAYITLDVNDTVGCATWSGLENGNRTDYTSSVEHMKTNNPRCVWESMQEKGSKMPYKTSRTSLENKTSTSHKRKDKPPTQQEKSKQAATQASKKQETPIPESLVTCESPTANTGCKAVPVSDVKTKEMPAKGAKSHGKKKKKPSHSSGEVEAETLKEAASSAQAKTAKDKTDALDASLAKLIESNEKMTNCLQIQKLSEVKNVTAKVKGKGTIFDRSVSAADTEVNQSTGHAKQQGEYILKRRHLFEDKDGQRATESKPQKSSLLVKKEKQADPAEAGHRRAYSDVVKQKLQTHKEVLKVLQNIRAEKLSDDSGGISLQCQFSAVSVESSVLWTKEGAVLKEAKRGAGDERLLSFTISKPSSKDLGRYQCCLSCPFGTLTSEFYLTSDVLIELLPSQDYHAAEVVEGVEEDVKCTPLLFKEDFLREQYFGENQPTSILTEQVHFGEGMYRRAFRTKLLDGMQPVFSPGQPCVLKVHHTISQGTKNSEELTHKNYSLAVEECYVQNTAREYIKAYTTVAKTAENFGEVPEIIPILLVHRPSNDIPYATLEEELIGDFVKYSVKDGKEINLTRRDSEPGQKCCAFQHWVYNKTEGNLLVTDMQGVGMKLTDVGIATPKKGYKGFRGNCATSFIDQFKALHQCNKYCELLGLKPLQSCQTKPKRTPTAPKPQSQPKKKPFAVSLKNKS